MSTGIPFRVFPELGPVDTSYRWFGGAVPPDRQAPACATQAPPASWAVERVVTRSRFIQALEIALPPTLAGRRRSEFDVAADAEAHGGILVASWAQPAAAAAANPRAGIHVTVWVGPEDGYPTIGADTATRQLYARQCRTRRADGEGYVVEFVLRGPHGTEGYLAALRRVVPGRYVRVLVGGVDAIHLPDARAILGSIRAIR